MTSTEILLMLAGLLGGLAFFLFGMNAMSDGLENMAGGALERSLKKITKSQFVGFLLGTGVTVVIQSSSAVTVMVVGLVNSGIINFRDTFGMIMGSNVGTTITAWLMSLMGISGDSFWITLLKPMTFSPILAFAGIVLQMVSKKEKNRSIGMIFIGFAVLMSGMDLMSSSMKVLQTMEGFSDLMFAFKEPIVALIVAVIFTGVIQSSSATVGIIQALAMTGAIEFRMAIPLVLGANIGTCVTALLSSLGTNKGAKCVAMMHLYVNAIGSVVCMVLLYICLGVFPEPLGRVCTSAGVAIVHTAFNIANTIILLPVKNPLIRLCEKTVRPDKEEAHTVFLDERIFINTSLAISECRRLTYEMAEHSREALTLAIEHVNSYDPAKAARVKELENLTDKYEDKLGTYLVNISKNTLSQSESHSVSRLLHSIGDFERIADHALNICDSAEEKKNKNIVFSNEANAEIKVICDATVEILSMATESFVNDDAVKASHVEPLEQVIDNIKDRLKSRHVDRLQRGECTIQLGFVFSDLLTNLERVSDHCSNIAVYTIQLNSSDLDAHKYLGKVKAQKSGGFIEEYNMYEKKYAID